MKKFLFSVCAVLAILGCGGENIEDLPPLNPGRSDYGGGYAYCRYYSGYGDYNCEYMSISDCNRHSGISYSDNSDCGGNYYPSSSSNRSSSSFRSSSSSVPSAESSSSFYVSVSCPNSSVSNGNVICGSKSYRTVKIGDQTWMAENLDYVVEGSKCYDNNPANCNTYGSLYNWSTAMDLPSSCNSNSCSNLIQSPHRGICPSGWHIPTQAEWNALMSHVENSSGCTSCDARLLKATTGWNSCGPSGSGSSYLCEDAYGFSALPGGGGNSDGNFLNAGSIGRWWSASVYNSGGAYRCDMGYYSEYAGWDGNSKSGLLSVRCLQD